MPATTKQPAATALSSLRVGDIMQRNVLTIRPEASVRELADLLQAKEVSGVPVVSDDGTVMGVVSLWDIVRLAGEEGKVPEMVWLAGNTADERAQSFFGWVAPGRPAGHPMLRTIRPPLLERHTVQGIMTSAVFHVREQATIPELARYLVASKIHRALVLEHGRLRGIVTATDVLEAIAQEEP
jgi:CBS domain-containing protein